MHLGFQSCASWSPKGSQADVDTSSLAEDDEPLSRGLEALPPFLHTIGTKIVDCIPVLQTKVLGKRTQPP